MTDDIRGMESRLNRSLEDLDIRLGVMTEQQAVIREAMEKTAAIMAVFVQRIERIDALLTEIDAQTKRFKLAQKIED